MVILAPADGTQAPFVHEAPDLMALDVVLVGSGFAGILLLWRLRAMGFKVHLVERNKRSGGVWSWNYYPGARVDSDVPTFELTDPELWSDWKWSQRFPDQKEILTYFDYVTKRLKIDSHASYNTSINSATWDDATKLWTLKSIQGATFRARRVVWCTGLFTKSLSPNIAGLDSFKGEVYHTASWPESGVDLTGKRVGVIGTGASAVQLIQDVAPIVEHLTVFQRTPNTALPMQQAQLPPGGHDKAAYPGVFNGFLYEPSLKSCLDQTPAEREAFFEGLFAVGGFSYYVGSYRDTLTSVEANNHAYEFWQRKVSARIKDKAIAELLAPLKPLHSFGAKRPCLEQRYYEVFNQDNVNRLVDVRNDAIKRVTPLGLETTSGAVHEVDVLVTATGFDAVTGGFRDTDIRGKDNRSLYNDGWKDGAVFTTLGLMTSGFPNQFYVFGPQAPFANGPTSIECMSEILLELLTYMRDNNFENVESTPAGDQDYKKVVEDAYAQTVLGDLGSGAGWFFGTNVPGGRCEPQLYIGGIQSYKKLARAEASAGYPNMVFS
ncbi:hypothetical protein RQP46_010616 [Phenoliferia psychrophenolica]